jgi:hypothetical protein
VALVQAVENRPQVEILALVLKVQVALNRQLRVSQFPLRFLSHRVAPE